MSIPEPENTPTPELGYCKVSDLLIGDLPHHDLVDAQRYVNDAADEIDSKIGYIYLTPVTIPADKIESHRTTMLTLRRINMFLATGRLIMSLATPGEETMVHAYAVRMVNEAQREIDRIAKREIILEGAEPNKNTPNEFAVSRGYVYQLDRRSAVEAFYQMLDPTTDGKNHGFINDFRRGDTW